MGVESESNSTGIKPDEIAHEIVHEIVQLAIYLQLAETAQRDIGIYVANLRRTGMGNVLAYAESSGVIRMRENDGGIELTQKGREGANSYNYRKLAEEVEAHVKKTEEGIKNGEKRASD